jgi:O-antigen/teichoic acid export membrane protein
MSEPSGFGAAVAAVRPAKASAGLGRNFVAMLVWQIGNYLVPLATFPYLTRVLGPEHFGVLSYVIAMTVYGTVFTEWGFNLSGPQAVIKHRDDPVALNELIWSTISAKACLCFVSFGILLVALCFHRQAGVAMPAVLLSWLIVVGNVITLNWLLQGLERFSLFATVSIAGRFITLPLTFLFVRNPGDVAAAVAIQAAAPILTGLFSLEVARRLGLLRRPHASWRSLWQRIAQGADMFVSTASVSLFSATNAIILGSMAGTYQVGIYAAADRLRTVGNMVPAQINTVLYPRISALFLDNKRSAARLALFGAIATIATTGAGVLAATLFGGPLTRLVLGNQYQGSSSVLTLLCIATLFGNLAYFLGLQVLVPFGGTRKRSRVMLAAGVTNIALAVLLVPKFGANGAATAFLIVEAVILVVYLFIIVRTPLIRAHFTQLLQR